MVKCELHVFKYVAGRIVEKWKVRLNIRPCFHRQHRREVWYLFISTDQLRQAAVPQNFVTLAHEVAALNPRPLLLVFSEQELSNGLVDELDLGRVVSGNLGETL